MTSYTPKFKTFAVQTYREQPTDIEKWVHSSDPTLAALCQDIANAAKQAAGAKPQ